MKKFFKILLWVVSIGLILFILSAASLPSILSSAKGNQFLIEQINRRIEGTVNAKEIHLSWFGEQRLTSFSFLNEKGDKVFSVEKFSTKTPLWHFFFKQKTLGATTCLSPYLHLRHQEPKEESTKRKLSKPLSQESSFIDLDKHPALPIFKDTLLLENGTFLYDTADNTTVGIENLSIQKTKDAWLIDANSKIGNQKGEFSYRMSVGKNPQVRANLTQFPINLLNPFFHGIDLTKWIGNTIDIQATQNQDQSVTFFVKSQYVNGSFTGKIEDKQIHIKQGGNLSWEISPTAFLEISHQNRLINPVKLDLQVNELTYPLSLDYFDLDRLFLEAKAQSSAIRIQTESDLLQIDEASFSISSQNHFQIDLQSQFGNQGYLNGYYQLLNNGHFLLEGNQIPTSLFSKELQNLLGMHANLKLEGNHTQESIQANLQLHSEIYNFIVDLEGPFKELRMNGRGVYLLDNEISKWLGSKIEGHFTSQLNWPAKSFAIEGEFNSPNLEGSFKGSMKDRFSWDHLSLNSNGWIETIPLLEEREHFPIQNGSYSFSFDGEKNKIHFFAKDPDHLDLQFFIENAITPSGWDLANAQMQYHANFKEFPTSFFKPYVPENLDLQTLLGSTLSFRAHGAHADEKGVIDLQLEGDGIEGSFSIGTQGGSLSIQKAQNAYIKWVCTPERYRSLLYTLDEKYNPLFTLVKPVELTFQIEEFVCPKDTITSDFLCLSGFKAGITSGLFQFRGIETGEIFYINGLQAHVDGQQFTEKMHLNMHGSIYAANIPKNERSIFSFSGEVIDLWKPSRPFSLETMNIQGELNLELIPVKQLTETIPMDPKTRELLQAILGNLLNARIHGEIQGGTGPFKVDVKASNFKTTLPLYLAQDAIYLQEDVQAEITLTDEVSRTLLADINPLLITGAMSDHPIYAHVQADGFVLPIRPYSLKNVQIQNAVLNIGKIQVRNGDRIQDLLSFLKAKGKEEDPTMEAWFTPIFFQQQNGVVRYERFDVLLDQKVHMALWGGVNLLNQEVRMTLAFSPSTLHSYFGISGLSKKDMFQVKMRGTTDNLDLDWSGASTRIGLIIARGSTGQIGNIIGGILEGIVKILGDQPAPPPTTSPLPWES